MLAHPGSNDPALGDARRWDCRLTPRGGKRFTLQLSGNLHAGWAAKLSAGLAARNISVVRVWARREPSLDWRADVEVDVLGPRTTLLELEIVALLREQAPTIRYPGRMVVSSFTVTRSPPDLEVQLRAVDSVGLLDRTLRLLAFYGLFPHELSVDTVQGEARDVFRLHTLTGEPTSERALASLTNHLASLTRS